MAVDRLSSFLFRQRCKLTEACPSIAAVLTVLVSPLIGLKAKGSSSAILLSYGHLRTKAASEELAELSQLKRVRFFLQDPINSNLSISHETKINDKPCSDDCILGAIGYYEGDLHLFKPGRDQFKKITGLPKPGKDARLSLEGGVNFVISNRGNDLTMKLINPQDRDSHESSPSYGLQSCPKKAA